MRYDVDLSAALGTIEHKILINRLEKRYALLSSGCSRTFENEA